MTINCNDTDCELTEMDETGATKVINNGDADFCFKKLTEDIYNNLRDNRGIHPSSKSIHDNGLDLAALINLITSQLHNQLIDVNLCNVSQTRCYLDSLLFQNETLYNALLCSVCGVWDRYTALSKRSLAVKDTTSVSMTKIGDWNNLNGFVTISSEVKLSKASGNALTLEPDGLLYVPATNASDTLSLVSAEDNSQLAQALSYTNSQAGISPQTRFRVSKSRYKLVTDQDILLTTIPQRYCPSKNLTTIGVIAFMKSEDTPMYDAAAPVLISLATTGELKIVKMSPQMPPKQYTMFTDAERTKTDKYPMESTSPLRLDDDNNIYLYDWYDVIIPTLNWGIQNKEKL